MSPPSNVQLPTVHVPESAPAPKPRRVRRPPAERDTGPTVARRTPARPRGPAVVATPSGTPAAAPAAPLSPASSGAGAGTDSAPSSPLGSDLPLEKVPSNARIVPAAQLTPERSSSVPEALARTQPSIVLQDLTGNPFQPSVQYRGFEASPIVGTPQNIAVYQNGVRINEVFGDVVNWDFLPDKAIRRMALVPGNPVFGLNATGGAIAIDMKTGFDVKGAELDVWGGSFGRKAISGEAGGQRDGLSYYIAADGIDDHGWRALESWSKVRRTYIDIGTRGESGELHVNFTGARNQFGNVGPTPAELLTQNWRNVYTTPQNTDNNLAMWIANGRVDLTNTLSVTGNLYFRRYRQKHNDGNVSEVAPCAADTDVLCFEGDELAGVGVVGDVPNTFPDGTVFGSIDRTAINAKGWGTSAQATETREVFGRPNQFLVGGAVDYGQVRNNASSELGTIPASLVVQGTGLIIANQGAAPVQVQSRTAYTGLYFKDTLDVTDRLSLTAGGRYNIAQIRLLDELATDSSLTGSHEYQRFNPMAGATFQITPWLSAYGSWSEANRAPTPVELACADPERPCLLEAFLVSDPDLKQVVSHTVEAGFRGKHAGPGKTLLTWSAGVFRTDSDDDIIQVVSTTTGRGYFQNAGTTRRQGVELNADLLVDRFEVHAGASFIDATFRSYLTLPSPNNPRATPVFDPNDPDDVLTREIQVVPGNVIPAVPSFRVKTGLDYHVTDAWTVGGDAIIVGPQYLVGDESNLNPRIPSYAVVNLRTTYKVSPNAEVFGRINNLFDNRYYTYGTFFEPGGVPFLGLTDSRTFSPSVPFAAYAGIRAKF